MHRNYFHNEILNNLIAISFKWDIFTFSLGQAVVQLLSCSPATDVGSMQISNIIITGFSSHIEVIERSTQISVKGSVHPKRPILK